MNTVNLLQKSDLQLLDKLPADQRTALEMAEVQNLSYGQISQQTGWPQGTVKSRLHRARRRIIALRDGIGMPAQASPAAS